MNGRSRFLPGRENKLNGTNTSFSIDVLQLSTCCRLVSQLIAGSATEMASYSSMYLFPLSCICQHCSGFTAVKEQTALFCFMGMLPTKTRLQNVSCWLRSPKQNAAFFSHSIQLQNPHVDLETESVCYRNCWLNMNRKAQDCTVTFSTWVEQH